MVEYKDWSKPGPTWRRISFEEGHAYTLQVTPPTLYDRAFIEGPTWQVGGGVQVPDPEGFVIDLFGVRFLDHYEPMLEKLSKANRQELLDLGPAFLGMVEILEAPSSAVQEHWDTEYFVLPGQMMWVMLDDLDEQDEINVWMSVLEARQ